MVMLPLAEVGVDQGICRPKYCHQSVIDTFPIASLQVVPGGGHFVRTVIIRARATS